MARKTKEQQKREEEEAKNSRSESDSADDDGMNDTPQVTPAADACIGLSGKNNGRSNNAENR
jgi:hypothetical protein